VSQNCAVLHDVVLYSVLSRAIRVQLHTTLHLEILNVNSINLSHTNMYYTSRLPSSTTNNITVN